MVTKIQRSLALAVALSILLSCTVGVAQAPALIVEDFINMVVFSRQPQRVGELVTWLRTQRGTLRFADVVPSSSGSAGYWINGRCGINFDSDGTVATILGGHCSADSRRDADSLFARWHTRLLASGRLSTQSSGDEHGILRAMVFRKTTGDWAYDADIRLLQVDDHFEVHVRVAPVLPLLSTH